MTLTKNRGWLAGLVLGLGIGCLSAEAADLPSAEPMAVGMSGERLSRLTDYADRMISDEKASGVVMLVARKGKVVYHEAAGLADIEADEAMTTDHYFRYFSMTKPIASVALLMLYEQGKFQLNDPIEDYLPEFSGITVAVEGGEPVPTDRPPTVADVFRHSAGFSYAGGLYESDTLEQLVDRLAQRPLSYQPGTQWVYSFAHDVQARLVEVLSGQGFEAFVRQRILEPLGIDAMVVGIPRDMADRFPVTYTTSEQGDLVPFDIPEETNYQQVAFGGSSLSGTTMAYARFAQMLVNGGALDGVRLLSPKTVAMMGSNQLPEGVSFRDGQGYGLGVRVVLDSAALGNLTSAGTFGWSGAASTHFIVDPEEELIAVLMLQYQPSGGRSRDEFETLVYQAIVE